MGLGLGGRGGGGGGAGGGEGGGEGGGGGGGVALESKKKSYKRMYWSYTISLVSALTVIATRGSAAAAGASDILLARNTVDCRSCPLSDASESAPGALSDAWTF